MFAYTAKSYVNCGDVVLFEEGLDSVLVRDLADTLADSCGGTAAVFSGSDEEGYGVCLLTREGDLPWPWFHSHSGGMTEAARDGIDWHGDELLTPHTPMR